MSEHVLMWCRWSLFYPALAALAALGVASLFPVDIAQRNFQDQNRVSSLALPRGVPYLFVSAGADPLAYRFAGYVLHNLGYPAQERAWVVLSRAESDRGRGALELDEGGQLSFVAHTGLGYVPPETLAPYVENGMVLFDTEEVRAEAERRLPLLKTARRGQVIAPFAPATLPWRSPQSLFTPTRIMRMTALLGLVLTLYPLILLRLPVAWRSPGLAAALAGPAAVAAVLWSCSWSQVAPLAAPGGWVFLAWACAGAGLWQTLRTQTELKTSMSVPMGYAGIGVCVVFLSVFLLRSDFDEDTHTHWMIMARSYYALGYHAPDRLVSHIHAATYPFGWAEVMSVCAWVADLPRSSFLELNEGTSLALLVYRTTLALLSLSAVGAAAAFLMLAAPASRLWLAAWALFPALFPVLTGQHVGAESLLLPLMATSMTTVWAGRRAGSAGLLTLGLFLGAVATLVKLEAGFLFALVVLPWTLTPGAAGMLRGSGDKAAALALGAGLVPALLWRLTLSVANTVYVWPTLGSVRAVLAFVAPTYLRCLLVIVKGTDALLLCAALPAATLLRFQRARLRAGSPFVELAVPISIAAACVGLASFYLFSTLPRAWQIDVSYGRLLLLPSWSAVLYCLDGLLPAKPKAA